MTQPLRQIRFLVFAQVAVGAVFTTLYWALRDGYHAASFATGAALAVANLVLLTWGWWRLLTQKPVAWTVVIIVSKYAVLLSSIFYLVRTDWFVSVPAGLGIASFIMPAVGLAFYFQEKE